jgi:hypothetical protein
MHLILVWGTKRDSMILLKIQKKESSLVCGLKEIFCTGLYLAISKKQSTNAMSPP